MRHVSSLVLNILAFYLGFVSDLGSSLVYTDLFRVHGRIGERKLTEAGEPAEG